ncbi:ANTAR domain-containing protein [Actinomycetes bacterium KLBMP 9759]
MSLAETAAAQSTAGPIGRFRWNVSEEVWVWNDGLYRMCGYEPAAVVPDGDLLLAHTALRDRETLRRHLDRLRDGVDFATVTSLNGSDGAIDPIAVVGSAPAGAPGVRNGWLVPLNAEHLPDPAQVPPGAVPEPQVHDLEVALASRDIIGQAKGMLRTRMGIGDAAAFSTLRWMSQNTNVRLSAVAAMLVRHVEAELPADNADQQEFTRSLLDFVGELRRGVPGRADVPPRGGGALPDDPT